MNLKDIELVNTLTVSVNVENAPAIQFRSAQNHDPIVSGGIISNELLQDITA